MIAHGGSTKQVKLRNKINILYTLHYDDIHKPKDTEFCVKCTTYRKYIYKSKKFIARKGYVEN